MIQAGQALITHRMRCVSIGHCQYGRSRDLLSLVYFHVVWYLHYVHFSVGGDPNLFSRIFTYVTSIFLFGGDPSIHRFSVHLGVGLTQETDSAGPLHASSLSQLDVPKLLTYAGSVWSYSTRCCLGSLSCPCLSNVRHVINATIILFQ